MQPQLTRALKRKSVAYTQQALIFRKFKALSA
jgi:hypothetical protein